MSVQDMQRGAQRARREHRRDAIRRVRAFQAWLKAGSPGGMVPEIPSNSDYKIARQRNAR